MKLQLSDEQRSGLIATLIDSKSPVLVELRQKLQDDSLVTFHEVYDDVSRNFPDKTKTALEMCWWFIENISEDDFRRNDIFFELREIVRGSRS